MKYFSTFSGIGGFEIGIQRAFDKQLAEVKQNRQGWNGTTDEVESDVLPTGWTTPLCVGYSEIDKYAIKVYERQFNGTKNYGDITKINADELPDFDCLVGGFPCQAFSIAGKRKGFDDTRGTLFFDLARILRAKQPRLFVFENVKGLLNHDNGNTFKTIIATIDELGYDCQWQVLNSKNHGVPQNRERVIIVGHLRGTARPKVFPIATDDAEDTQPDKGRSTELFPTIRATHYKNGDNQPLISKTVRSGGRSSPHGSKQNWDSYEVEGTIRRLTPTECERLQGFPDIEKRAIIDVCKKIYVNGAEKVSRINVINPNNAAPVDVLISCVENGVEIRSQGKLVLSVNTVTNQNSSALSIPLEDFVQINVGITSIVERIISLGKVEYRPNVSNLTGQLFGKNSENGFGLEIMQPARDAMLDTTTHKDFMKSIILNHLDSRNLDLNLITLFFYVMNAINGFIPQEILKKNTLRVEIVVKYGWTKYGVGDEPISDTQRYKMCGNAVTTNVIRDVFERIFASENV